MPDVANSRSLTRNKHELFDHVLAAILKSGKEGVFQTEICREFSLDSRDGSRLAGNLEKQSLISREKVLHKGRWTYKLIVKKSP
ncbi:MAG TPA: helix-turn-helix domain-containing protein, partial [Nitrososphaeraceae archaeon]|nr:helix-turn-helix domain-containing protein [Nitrososphaeraceae archaeon]